MVTIGRLDRDQYDLLDRTGSVLLCSSVDPALAHPAEVVIWTRRDEVGRTWAWGFEIDGEWHVLGETNAESHARDHAATIVREGWVPTSDGHIFGRGYHFTPAAAPSEP
jgi:hypothetical protein